MATITSTGLGSGLDIEGIVTKLMTVEAQPLTQLATKEASYQAKLTAIGTFTGSLSSFQSAAAALDNTSTINAVSTSSSNTSVVTASGTSAASTGSYSVEVTQLAKSQSIVAQGQTTITNPIGTGTITFDFGTISGGAFNAATGQYTGASFTSNGSGSHSVTITAANNSLAGIRDAINAAGIGVTASIVNDGSAAPYRLVLSSNAQGASNSIKVSVNPTGGALDNYISNDPAGTQNLKETVTAQNSTLLVNGISVSSSSNSVSSAISGVTLNLLNTNLGTPATITVGRDSSSFTTLIGKFVTAYNDLNKTITDLTKYDSKTGVAGTLIGDPTLRTVQSQIRTALFSSVPGLKVGAYNNTTQVGLGLDKSGNLTLDSAKLSSALSTNSNDVASLFASFGRPTDALVKYVSSSSTTTVSSRALNITAVASQGAAVGTLAAASTTITAGVNDSLSVSIDGVAATVTIAPGVYSQASLDNALQAAINGNSTISSAGASVAVTDAGGIITITSNKYGSASKASVIGGTAALNLFGAASIAGTTGVDVAGTFAGTSATGSGQTLTTTDGLVVQVSGGITGNRGTVEFSRGLGYLLNNLVNSYTSTSGVVAGETTGINNSIARIGQQRAELNLRLTALEKKYRAQFTAMDSAIASLNQTSTFLTQQLGALNGSTASKK